jgi:hypothetical protein
VLLAASAISLGLAMHFKFENLDRNCGDGNVSRPGCNESDIAAVRSREIAANVMWGLTGAAAVAAGVLFYVEGRPISVAPLAGETTGIVAVVRY